MLYKLPPIDILVLPNNFKGLCRRLLILLWHGKWIKRRWVQYMRRHRKINVIDRIIGWKTHKMFDPTWNYIENIRRWKQKLLSGYCYICGHKLEDYFDIGLERYKKICTRCGKRID